MKFFGWGSDEAKRASDATAAKAAVGGSALERAATSKPEGGLAGAANSLVHRLMDLGIDGRGPIDSAAKVAADALAKTGDPEKAIALVTRNVKLVGAGGGFVTGLGGFVVMPVSLPVNILEFYTLATRVTAATAILRGYDVSQPHVRTAVLLTLVGADSDDILLKAGVQASSGKLTSLATRGLPAPVLMVLNKAIGFRLVGQVGRSTFSRLGKGVPVMGGVIGAGLDFYMMGKIAEQARAEFPPVAPALTS